LSGGVLIFRGIGEIFCEGAEVYYGNAQIFSDAGHIFHSFAVIFFTLGVIFRVNEENIPDDRDFNPGTGEFFSGKKAYRNILLD